MHNVNKDLSWTYSDWPFHMSALQAGLCRHWTLCTCCRHFGSSVDVPLSVLMPSSSHLLCTPQPVCQSLLSFLHNNMVIRVAGKQYLNKHTWKSSCLLLIYIHCKKAQHKNVIIKDTANPISTEILSYCTTHMFSSTTDGLDMPNRKYTGKINNSLCVPVQGPW